MVQIPFTGINGLIGRSTPELGEARILQDLDGILQWNKTSGVKHDSKSASLSMSDESSYLYPYI